MAPQQVNENEARLNALLASIGLTSLDALEDFIFLHGASKLVPISTNEARSLETQVASTAEELHERRKRALQETKEELARVRKELEYTQKQLEKEKLEKESAKSDLKWFIESQRDSVAHAPAHRAHSPRSEEVHLAHSESLERDFGEAQATITCLEQKHCELMSSISAKDAELAVLHGDLSFARGKLAQYEARTLARSDPAVAVASASSVTDRIYDATHPHLEACKGPGLTITRPASPLRSDRARRTQYETVRNHYINMRERIQNNEEWSRTKVRRWIDGNQDHLAALPPVPAQPDPIELPDFPALQDLLDSGGLEAFDSTLDSVMAMDQAASILADQLRAWKIKVKELAHRVTDAKKAKDAVAHAKPVKKRRRVTKTGVSSPSSKRAIDSSAATSTRSHLPLRSSSTNRSPRQEPNSSPPQALNAPASSIANRAGRIFSLRSAVQPLPPSSPKIKQSPRARSSSLSQSDRQDTQIPESPRKTKRKIDLGLDTAEPSSSKRSRVAIYPSQRSPITPLVFAHRHESPTGDQDLARPRATQTQAEGVTSPDMILRASQQPLLRRSSRSSSTARHQPQSSWGPEPDTEPDDFFLLSQQGRQVSSTAKSTDTRTTGTIQPIELLPVIAGSLKPAPSVVASVSAPSSTSISRAAPLSPNRRATNRRISPSPIAMADGVKIESCDQPSPTSHRSSMSSPLSPVPDPLPPAQSTVLRSPLKRFRRARTPSSSPADLETHMRYHPALGSPPLPAPNWAAIESRSQKGKAKEVQALLLGREDLKRSQHQMGEKETQSDDGIYIRRPVKEDVKQSKKGARKSEPGLAGPEGSATRKHLKTRSNQPTPLPDRDDEEDSENLAQKSDDPTGYDFMRRLHAKRAREAKLIAEEKAKRSRSNSPAIEINPDRNAGRLYHFQDVERGKAAREQMFAHDCEECAGYYAIAHTGLDVSRDSRKCSHRSTKAQASGSESNHFLEQRHRAMQDLLQKTSRHRKHHRPDPDPPDFWQMGFPSTARIDDINTRAEAQRKEKQLWKEAQADEGGFYRYRGDAPEK